MDAYTTGISCIFALVQKESHKLIWVAFIYFASLTAYNYTSTTGRVTLQDVDHGVRTLNNILGCIEQDLYDTIIYCCMYTS